MSPSDRVAVVIVTWNSEAEIGGCLDALLPFGVEIVVVDNASSDSTRLSVEGRAVRLITNPSNLGFGAAVNQGVRATSSPLILLLNPDAHLQQGLAELAATFEDVRTGAASGLLLGDDGLPQRGFMARNLPSPVALTFEVLGINRLWPSNPVNWHYRCLGLDPIADSLVEQPAGAFLMFSREAWENIGGFDERFWPVWFEDVDFCARLKGAGYRIRYIPAAVAKHAGSHSIRKLTLENRQQYWYGNLLEYAAKHFRPAQFRAVCLAVFVGTGLRAAGAFARINLKKSAVYGSVAKLALSRFCGGKGSGREGVV